MIHAISVTTVELVPQAILNKPVRDVIGRHALVSLDWDELDLFEGASFKLDSDPSLNIGSELEIAVRHYRGYPVNTSAIYIDRKISDVHQISALIRLILKEFNLSEDVLSWERADNPEL